MLLRALANFAQRDRFRLDIYGTIEGAEKIQQLICRLGLSDRVTMHGFVPHDELDEALRRTDLVVNLRNPSMGEASGSQLHLWQYALPSLVTRSAWYETLPANTVAFVRPDQETEDIQAHLAAFLDEPEKYRELGRNGRLTWPETIRWKLTRSRSWSWRIGRRNFGAAGLREISRAARLRP